MGLDVLLSYMQFRTELKGFQDGEEIFKVDSALDRHTGRSWIGEVVKTLLFILKAHHSDYKTAKRPGGQMVLR